MSLVLERRVLPGLAALWRRYTAVFRDDGSPRNARSQRRFAPRLSALAGIALFGVVWGCVVAIAELNALYLCIALIGCAFILLDFRIGVVLLILLLPISRSNVFPHAMFGITGLNPFNLLLIATLGSCLLSGLSDGSLRRFIPRPLLWLYIVPILVAGALGSRHVGDIAPNFFVFGIADFHDAAGYLNELVFKPLLTVIFALLVGAAVSKSEKPERFLILALISIWVMGAMVIVFVLLSGVGLKQLASSGEARNFLSVLGLHANDLGRLYVIAYALLVFTWAESKEAGLRLVLFASMGLVAAALVLTFSRGAFLGFVVVNMLFLLWHRSAKTLILIGLMAAAPLLLPDAVYDRITSGSGEGLNAVSAGRVEWIWLPLLPEVLRSPIYGNGLGSILWSEAMHRADGITILPVGHPHNAYLQALLDMGIAGLVLMCAYFAHVWKGIRVLSVDPALSPELRGFYRGAAAGLLTFLVTSLTDSSLTPVPEQAFLWLAIGMMYGQRAYAPVHESGRSS
jgi:O-antigen ligase/polysaccharide polymerase Wzy-like membrane protein